MRKLINTLALVLLVFTSLLFNVCNADESVPNYTQSALETIPYNTLSVDYSRYDMDIATWNNDSIEISSTDNNSSFNLSIFISDVPLFDRYNNKCNLYKNNKYIVANSHKISPLLKNEICTRAP